jgi:O-antigen ligase
MIGVSNSNQLAALVALVGAVFAAFTGKWLQKLLAGLVVIGFLAAPLLPTTVLAPERWAASFDEKHYSALHRLHIWNFAAQRITDAPVIGWGLDAARRIPGGDTKLAGGGNVMSVHTHNGSLQIWLELGAVGALIFAGLLAALWLRIAILEERSLRAGGTGLLLSALMVANLSFGIWQTWWMASLALSGLLFMIAQKLKLDERLNI